MFAVYASEGNIENPLTSLAVGERPEPVVPEGWVRVKVSHASLNRHDIWDTVEVPFDVGVYHPVAYQPATENLQQASVTLQPWSKE
jgi:NADPH:quinone reductase-like Zn-dependent oxidoreductase